MKRVLVTGLSGTGKSSVLAELAARGYKTVDTDYGGWSELVDVPPSEGLTSGLRGNKDQLWREDRIAELLATEDAEVLFIGGAAPNQVKFRTAFDHIVLLSAPVAVMRERLTTRDNNPYGKHPEELARALALKESIEPRLRKFADLEIDTSAPLDRVVAEILRLVLRSPAPG